MRNRVLVLLVFFTAFVFYNLSFAQGVEEKASPKEEIIAIAKGAVEGEGIKLDDVQIIYDEDNKLWQEHIGKMTELVNSPNFGIKKKGFLKNYRIVYFDFKEPLPDIWVFIDKDTGEVLEVYKVKLPLLKIYPLRYLVQGVFFFMRPCLIFFIFLL